MSATAEGGLREQLKKIEAELAATRDKRVPLQQAVDDAREAYASAENPPPAGSPEFNEAQETIRALGECDDTIHALQQTQIGVLRMLGQNTPDPQDSKPAGDPSDPRGAGWDSSGLFSTAEIREMLTYAATSKSHLNGIELGQVISRDAFAADVTGTEAMRRGEYLGVVPQLRRVLRVLSLIPTATMDNNTLPYTQESGSFATAKGTKEGETKPEGGIIFTDAEAVARTIAHWMKIRKQALSDFAALRGIIDSRLRYGVERKLEEEILIGKAADPELTGILHTAGLGIVKVEASVEGTGTYVAEQVLRAITTTFLADAVADGIVMHPTDWQTALLSKSTYVATAGTTGGSGEFVGGGPFQITPTQLWGVPLVPSASMKEAEILVGDFSLGCQLFIREGVNVLLSDSDQDDFIKNRVTMLAEMRAALAVFRPAAFTKAWLTKAAETAGN